MRLACGTLSCGESAILAARGRQMPQWFHYWLDSWFDHRRLWIAPAILGFLVLISIVVAVAASTGGDGEPEPSTVVSAPPESTAAPPTFTPTPTRRVTPTPRPTRAPTQPPVNELSGQGQGTEPINLTSGLWIVHVSVRDNSACSSGVCFDQHFAVSIEGVNGGTALVVNQIASEWSGSDTVRVGGGLLELAPGKQIVSVASRGKWTVRFQKQ